MSIFGIDTLLLLYAYFGQLMLILSLKVALCKTM